MNKKIVSMILGLSLSSMAFGVSILIPDSYNGHWVRYTNVKSYNITASGILIFEFNGKKIIASNFIIKED